MRRKVGGLVVRLLGPVLLVVVIARIEEPAAVLRVVVSADLAPLLAALALNVVTIHLKVTRWNVLLRTRGIVYPVRRAWAAFVASLYVGLLTPGRVGDALRAQYLRHEAGVPYSEGIASIVMDRLCDLYVLVAFAAVGVARFGSVVVGRLAYVTWASVAVIALAPLLLLVPGIAERVMRLAYRKVSPGGEASGMPRFLEALRAQTGRGLFASLPLTLAAFLVNYAQGWLLARALHLDISLWDMSALMAIASLLGLLPISVSGLGVREAFFALVFPVLGHSAEAGVSFGLLVFAVFYLVLVGVGFVGYALAPPPVQVASVAGSPKRAGGARRGTIGCGPEETERS